MVESSIVIPLSSCTCGSSVAAGVSGAEVSEVSVSSDGFVVSGADVALDVASGVEVASVPSEFTVLVVPSTLVTVDVEVSGSEVGSVVGCAKEITAVDSEIKAVRIKEISLLFFIIISLPPSYFFVIYLNILLYLNNNYNAIKISLNL